MKGIPMTEPEESGGRREEDHHRHHAPGVERKAAADDVQDQEERMRVFYKVDERPPPVLLIVLGFQQFLTMFGATFSFPILMGSALCLKDDTVGTSQVISTVIFVAGLSTLIQTTFGIRLAIIQSSSYSFVAPFMVLLSLPEWKCAPCVRVADGVNMTCGSDAHADLWQARLRELSGAMLVGSLFQMLVGFTGLLGVLLQFIGPLTIAPTVAMIGLSLFDVAAFKAQGQWWIALLTVALMAIFSQYLRNVQLPFCGYRKGRGCIRASIQFFALFPVLLAVAVVWFLSYVFTVTDVLSPNDGEWGYRARTDVMDDAIGKAPWFRFPYPGQWGVPTVSVAGVLGALAGTLASVIESVGDYYACARLSGAPPPPKSAICRGIGVEGITCLLAGAWGSGGGTTSYSENIAAIGITKVASRSVVQVSALIMIVVACIGKFSAIFATIPDPIVGGLFIAMFGMVAAVGISNLQHVDLNSSRNLFILGTSIFMGLCVPKWLALPDNASAISTGSEVADNVLTVLCSTSMFVSGAVAFLFDNTIPGTQEERGLHKWKLVESDANEEELKVYDLPWIQPWLNKSRVTRYLPFCPGFTGCTCGRRESRKLDGHVATNERVNEGFKSV